MGGRVATERVGDYTFDSGATTISPRGRAIEKAMLGELSTDLLVRVSKPIYIHQFGRILPGDPVRSRAERYAYRPGNALLATMLGEGVDVRFQTKIETLERFKGGAYALGAEEFDALILTPPVPLTQGLLTTIGENRPFANCRYRMCLSVLLGYAVPFLEGNYHAVVDPEQRHPLTWLSIESVKSPDRAPSGHTAMVAQMGPDFSRTRFESSDESIVAEAVGYISRLFGKGFAGPERSEVKRWRYSQPEQVASFDLVNRAGSKLIVASDGLIGARVEFAYDAGRMSAESLMQ